jgi:hypothetical protein
MIEKMPSQISLSVVRMSIAAWMIIYFARYQFRILLKSIKYGDEREHLINKRAMKKPPIDITGAWDILKQVQQFADQCDAKPFVISGTLLGIHRNGQLLPHDNDMDLGIHADDPGLARFIEALASWKYTVKWKEVSLSRCDKLLNPWIPLLPNDVIIHKFDVSTDPEAKPIRIDIFVHFKSKGYVVHGTNRSLWLNTHFDLAPSKLDGVVFWLPADRARYLTENYGDFETPKVSFESFVECPNCVNIYTFSAVRAIVSKWSLFKRTRDLPRRALIRERINDVFGYTLGKEPVWEIRSDLSAKSD